MKLIHVFLLFLCVVMSANMFLAHRSFTDKQGPASNRSDAFGNIQLFTRVMEQVRENYVDEDKVGYEDLVVNAMEGMLESLDPYCQFLDQAQHQDIKEDTEGKFGGLGVIVNEKDGVLFVVMPMEGTPGFEAGLKPGDKILALDGNRTADLKPGEAIQLMRGKPKTKIVLNVLSQGDVTSRDVTVVREVISVPSVTDVRMLDDETGYLRIANFNRPTAQDLQRGIEKLQLQGMKGLVIDLRGNPGGLLTSAIEVVQKFLPKGELIVFTQGRDARDRSTYHARGSDHYEDLPLVVLVNSESASASEIVAGALQDHKRAILVGETTYGKGSVQTIIPVDKARALRITTARYYTPSEKVIHDNGVEPSIKVPLDDDAWRSMIEDRREAITEGRDVPIDPQMKRAMEVLFKSPPSVDSGDPQGIPQATPQVGPQANVPDSVPIVPTSPIVKPVAPVIPADTIESVAPAKVRSQEDALSPSGDEPPPAIPQS